jgi:hypothetical protein
MHLASGNYLTGCRTSFGAGMTVESASSAIGSCRQKAVAKDVAGLHSSKPLSSILQFLTKASLATIIFAFVGASLCHAQGTFTAASCSRTDVNAVINGPTHTAVNGDKIVIPAGSCTWTSGITVSGVGIDITGNGTPNTGAGTVGAGTSNTSLTNNASAPFFVFTGLRNGQTAKVELLTLSASGAGAHSIIGALSFAGTCSSGGCADIRVDNITFSPNTWGPASGSGAVILVDNVFGVIDHNTQTESASGAYFMADVSFDAWQGVGAYGDNSFASADTFGTAQSLYIENNKVSGVRLTENDVAPVGGAVGGARYVCRFNILTNMSGDGLCGAHGTAWGGRFRGVRQQEVYYNTVSGSVCDSLNSVLSGTGYFLSNTITGAGCNAMASVDIARFVQSGEPWNSCNGTEPWDQAPWSSTSACLDQPGRGAGELLQNAIPVLASAASTVCSILGQCWQNPALDPIYEAGEISPNNAPGVRVATDGTSTRVLANRDYYAQVSDVAQTSPTSPFNGTSGTGYGKLANRPTTCTPGVGYWATDQGSWNNGGGGQGQLFTCGSGNSWNLHYTPYTYPHPLTTGASSPVQTLNPPTSLTATVQ